MHLGPRVFQDQAALKFGAATSNRVDCGNNAIIQNLDPFSVLFWVQLTTLTSGRRLFQKSRAVDSPAGFKFINLSDALGNFSITVARATTGCTYTTTGTPIVVNTWTLIAATFASAVSPTAHLYAGTIQKLAAETAYATTTDGTGAVIGDSGDDFYLANSSALNLAMQGNMAAAALFNRVLTLAEIQAWQMTAFDEPWPAVMGGCVGLWYPGAEGTGTVIDYSGFLNTGTNTGGTAVRGPTFPVADLRRQLVA